MRRAWNEQGEVGLPVEEEEKGDGEEFNTEVLRASMAPSILVS